MEGDEKESTPPDLERSLDEVLEAVKESLTPQSQARAYKLTKSDERTDDQDQTEDVIIAVGQPEPRSILKKPRKKNTQTSKALHWADEVDEPLATEHEMPWWDRRPNLAMFRFDLIRAPHPPAEEEICCFMTQKTLMGVGLVSLILLGSVALVLLFKLLGIL